MQNSCCTGSSGRWNGSICISASSSRSSSIRRCGNSCSGHIRCRSCVCTSVRHCRFVYPILLRPPSITGQPVRSRRMRRVVVVGLGKLISGCRRRVMKRTVCGGRNTFRHRCRCGLTVLLRCAAVAVQFQLAVLRRAVRGGGTVRGRCFGRSRRRRRRRRRRRLYHFRVLVGRFVVFIFWPIRLPVELMVG